MSSDDGGPDWKQSCWVYTPDGLLFKFSQEQVQQSHNLYERLRSAGSDALDAYQAITSRSLGEWVTAEPLRLGISATQDIVYKALVDPIHELYAPSITQERLVELAEDENWHVRSCVAEHHDTSVELLTQLTSDEDPAVRWLAACNSNMPVDTLTQLAGDRYVKVREAVASHPNTASDTLAQLAGDENQFVRSRVAGNIHTPLEILPTFAEDENEHVREGVAGNPSTPSEILILLTGDWNKDVVAAAQDSLKSRSQPTVTWMMSGWL
jgi:HEAT repeat protein